MIITFLAMTLGVVRMLCFFVACAVATWAGIVVLGLLGFWKVLEHEEVDTSAPVMTWPNVAASNKKKNSDFVGPRLECPVRFGFTEPLFGPLLRDKRDLPLLHLLVACCCVLVPMALVTYWLFLQAPFSVAVAFGGGAYQFVRVRFFMNGMLHFRHFTSHAPLFEWRALNILPNIFLDPLMGIPPVVFLLHHPVMHHVGNNGYYDVSSTEPFLRDSWIAFANYWLRFQIGAYVELPLYALQTGRTDWCLTAVAFIGSFFYVVRWLATNVSGWATFFVFGAPWLYDHATDAVRNWCQHLFVVQPDAPNPPASVFDFNSGLAYNIIDSLENRTQFNEGYHVVHHAASGTHWSDIPNSFYAHVEKLKTHDADVMFLTFARTSVWDVWAHVACGKLPQYVKNHFIHIPTRARPDPPTIAHVVAELKSRLEPIRSSKASSAGDDVKKPLRLDSADPTHLRLTRARANFKRHASVEGFVHLFLTFDVPQLLQGPAFAPLLGTDFTHPETPEKALLRKQKAASS
ncbi:hypothetical protein CTAYLR_007961 [Chrysophaeum taylorii]|uniref:Fatty acid desaturase domain-containing protein n=1 Tax=Chrysophaeum taylorii TaxID=2483200 RepID=A0AAD7XGY1_9STRA|nr:hypothetical protein CTAYLR_007961 [Chrysophaeum taylorii]